MNLSAGLVGLPNVGKSTLFNALLGSMQAMIANYPFCTIDPNIGMVILKDTRLQELAKISKSQKILYANLQVVDIAGLVKGASKGEGMGNAFLHNIAEVDAIIHVLRCFSDSEITHVCQSIDPIRDKKIIETELLLSDLQKLEKILTNLRKKYGQNALTSVIIDAVTEINEKQRLSYYPELACYGLLSYKPVLYVCNVGEEDLPEGNQYSDQIRELVGANRMVIISTKIEAEIAQLSSEEEKDSFLSTMQLTKSGLTQIVYMMYKLLGLITYFTTGPKETRAWTIRSKTSAPVAAGKIHSDFERKFIRAEVVDWESFVHYGGWSQAKAQGKVCFEGKQYIVQDGDVIIFHHS